ncbi:MAG: polysaccharide pyruvyl transferase family protein [bacterium]|nr:polysaccharide pyruvyl transferase family protein [bacterium]
MKNILISGYYGMNNTGDDALLAVTSWGGKRFLKADKIIVTAVQVPLFNGSHFIYPAFLKKKHFIGENRLRLYYHAFKAQNIILGGGSVLHSSNSMKGIIDLLKLSGKGPHVALGVSIGPFRDLKAEKVCSSLLKRLSFVGLRDQSSFEIAKQIAPCVQIEKTFDLAVLLPKSLGYSIEQIKSDITRRGIGLALCNYERYIGGDTNREKVCKQKVLQVLSKLYPEEIDEIVLIDFNGHPFYGDHELHSEIAERLKSRFYVKHLFYNSDPIVVLKWIASLRCLIAMRLHAAVFGYMTQTPTIMLPYHVKCLAWASEIKMPLELILCRDSFEVDELIMRIREIIAGRASSPSLPLKVAETLAMRNWIWEGSSYREDDQAAIF